MIASMLMLLAPALLLLSLSNKCSAQATFLAPTIYSDVSCGNYGTRTANDVKIDNNNDTILAWVMNRSGAATVYWTYQGLSGNQTLQFPLKVKLCDVAITMDASNNIWIMVVYYDQQTNKAFIWETYEWNSITTIFDYKSYQILESTTYTTISFNNIDVNTRQSINIDEEFGNFVIVWNDKNALYAWAGVSLSTGPSLITGTAQTLYTGVTGTYEYRIPDVSIYSISTSTPDVYICYLDTSIKKLLVDEYSFSSSTGLSATPTNVLSTSYNDAQPPRIACAPSLSGTSPSATEDWTVVWMDHVTTDYQIYGATYCTNTSTLYYNTYTTLCTTNIDLTQDEFNFNPVVTYSSSYDGSSNGGIIVSWITDGQTPIYSSWPVPYVEGLIPFAIKCDKTGAAWSGNCNYLIVPTNQNTAWHDYQVAISLAGRDYPCASCSHNNDDIFYLWSASEVNSVSVNSLERKEVSWSGGNNSSDWRKQNNVQANQILNGAYPNPNSGTFNLNLQSENGETINIEIYNSMGQKVYSSEEVSTTTFYTKEITLKNDGEGIYFVRETGSTTSNNWKIVVTN